MEVADVIYHSRGNGVFCSLTNVDYDNSFCIHIDDRVGEEYGKVKVFCSRVEWINFKNSVLAADEKMFGRR